MQLPGKGTLQCVIQSVCHYQHGLLFALAMQFHQFQLFTPPGQNVVAQAIKRIGGRCLWFFCHTGHQGVEPFQAVVDGGLGRLRAILLTSATTVLGLLPLIFERSFQAKFLIPMAVAVSSGLIFATVLTLIGVPSIYLIVLDAKRLGTRARRWLFGTPTPELIAEG